MLPGEKSILVSALKERHEGFMPALMATKRQAA